MGKAFADPLMWFLSTAVLVQAALVWDRRRLLPVGRVGLALLAVATAGLWLLGTHAAETYLIGRLSAVHPIPADEDVARIDVVVVLSGGFVDAPAAAYDQPDAWTTARVVQGVRTFFESGARVMVVSGRWMRAGAPADAASDDPARLARAMKQLAADLGVPPDRIVVEPNARTTREHPVELLRMRVVAPGETVGVVTSSWHLPRAMREFEQVFEDVVAVPAFHTPLDQKSGVLRWLPRSMHLASSATALAEYIGMVWYRWRFG